MPLPKTMPIPMKATPQHQRLLENTPKASDEEIKLLERETGFSYRTAIGELIYAMITCRPDISYSVIKLSQYSTRPAAIHFEAVKMFFKYMWQTKDKGITYWRKQPRLDLPSYPLPSTEQDNKYDYNESLERKVTSENTINSAVDSDYAGDTSHRKSVTGLTIRLAGGCILYKTRYQDTIAMSSTEAEFTAAAEADKFILYVRSILEEINMEQQYATTLYEDNRGALLMANAQQSTKQTRHMDITTFALQDWCERDLIVLHKIHTSHNWADTMTKAQSKYLFHRHMYHIMGNITPGYSKQMLGIHYDKHSSNALSN